MHHIICSRVWYYPSVIKTILCHVPVLDLFVVLRNSILILCVAEDGKIFSFVSVKNHIDHYELGTVYTYPMYRNKGYASALITYVLQRYQPIGLLCKSAMISYYQRFGFQEDDRALWMIRLRRILFNIFLQPIWKHPLVSMMYKGKVV